MSKKTLKLFLSFTTLLLFSTSSYAYNKGEDYKRDRQRAYKPKFKKNYKRYKSYSPKKRKQMKKTWNSFKKGSKWQGLSPEEKKRLRERVLNKKRN